LVIIRIPQLFHGIGQHHGHVDVQLTVLADGILHEHMHRHCAELGHLYRFSHQFPEHVGDPSVGGMD